jgi:ABC-type transport system substrate-binding protein
MAALFSNILAGSVDLFMDLSLNAELGFQLTDRWHASGDGTVRLLSGYVRFLMPQWRPAFQKELGNLDGRVRAALYQAIDRETLTEALQFGHRELAAHAILPPGDRNFDGARDALRRYAYDPERARALLREAGWTPGADGVVRSAPDGRRFRTSLWTTPGSDQEIAAIADYWRRVGIDVEEFVVPAAFTRNNEYRASYPGWETTANYAEAILGRLHSPAGPETRWAGGEPCGL